MTAPAQSHAQRVEALCKRLKHHAFERELMMSYQTQGKTSPDASEFNAAADLLTRYAAAADEAERAMKYADGRMRCPDEREACFQAPVDPDGGGGEFILCPAHRMLGAALAHLAALRTEGKHE